MAIDYTRQTGATGATGAPVSLSKVTLTKSAPGVSLTKSGSATGILRVNLNWNARPAPASGPVRGGFLKRLTASQAPGIDLDLGCLYEYSDGSKGVVQALGNSFRDTRHGDPICWLDGDDRSGSNSGGENLYVNLQHVSEIRRLLVFAYIYEGVASWAACNAVVTLFPTAGPQVEVRLDEHDPKATMCGIASLTNGGGELSVKREVRYVAGHRYLDEAYHWGLQWSAGRK